MRAQHDHVLNALKSLEAALEAKDPLAAEIETQHVLELLGNTTDPSGDARLLPLFAHCQKLADQLKASLVEDLRNNAVSHRATSAYEREAREEP